MNSNSSAEPREIPWFFHHTLVANYLLADWLAETYEDWIPLRDELATFFDRRETDESKDER